MSDIFVHYREAQMYAVAVANIQARTALNAMHHLLLEVGGLPLHFLPERYRPVKTLDVLFFFKAVERLFTEWTGKVRHYPEVPGNRERLLHLEEATALIPTLPTETARTGLRTFLAILLNAPVPKGTFVDTLFCSRLLAVLFSHSELLEHILSGDDSWETRNPWEGVLD
jgi:hypothetical protein